MAGKGKSNGDGSSAPRMNHVRAFVLEATMTDEGLAQLTQALTGFVRPAAPSGRMAAPVTHAIAASPIQPVVEVEDVDSVQDEGDEEEVAVASAASPSKPRVYRSPKVLELELNSDPSWPDFAAEKKPESVPDRYLVVAAWFKKHRGIEAISMDHVYTCFIHPKVKWSTNLEDFDAMLRYHKKRNRMTKAKGKGMYAINHIGLDEVEMMGGTKAEA
jgi:hypothetical protein